MTDIVARLRKRTDPNWMLLTAPPRHPPDRLCQEAADEITRLRAELAAERKEVKDLSITGLGFVIERDALRAENEKLRDAVNGKLFDKALKAFDENERLTAERDAWKTEAEKWIARHIDLTELFETAEAERDELRALLRQIRSLTRRFDTFFDDINAEIDAALKGDGDERA